MESIPSELLLDDPVFNAVPLEVLEKEMSGRIPPF